LYKKTVGGTHRVVDISLKIKGALFKEKGPWEM
jgi:hypothetical protein